MGLLTIHTGRNLEPRKPATPKFHTVSKCGQINAVPSRITLNPANDSEYALYAYMEYTLCSPRIAVNEPTSRSDRILISVVAAPDKSGSDTPYYNFSYDVVEVL